MADGPKVTVTPRVMRVTSVQDSKPVSVTPSVNRVTVQPKEHTVRVGRDRGSVRVINDRGGLVQQINRNFQLILDGAPLPTEDPENPLGTLVAPYTTGTDTAYSLVTARGPLTTLPDGLIIWFTPHIANAAGPVTLDVDGLGPREILLTDDAGDQTLPANKLRANAATAVQYQSRTGKFHSGAAVTDAALVEYAYSKVEADSAITEQVTALQAAMEAPTGSVGQISANLSNNYRTEVDTDSAIASEISALQASMEAPSGSVGSLSANLSNNYRTEVDTDSAIASEISALQASMEAPTGSIGSLSANLSNNYRTEVDTDSAIASEISALQASMEAPTGSIGSLSANLSNNYRTEVDTDSAIASEISALQASMEAPGGSIGSLSANLSNNYRTEVDTDSAIASEISALQASMEAPTGSIGSLSANLSSNYRTEVATDAAIAQEFTAFRAEVGVARGLLRHWEQLRNNGIGPWVATGTGATIAEHTTVSGIPAQKEGIQLNIPTGNALGHAEERSGLGYGDIRGRQIRISGWVQGSGLSGLTAQVGIVQVNSGGAELVYDNAVVVLPASTSLTSFSVTVTVSVNADMALLYPRFSLSKTAGAATYARFFDMRYEDVTELETLSSSVTTNSTAIATLEGHLSASYSFRVQAGTAGAELELIASDDPTGPVSIARIAATNIVLVGSVSLDLLQADVMNANNIVAGTMSVGRIDVNEVLAIDAVDGGFALGKFTPYNLEDDGIFMGRTDEGGGVAGFGFAMSLTQGGQTESIQATSQTGLKINNAKFYRDLSPTSPFTTETTSKTVVLSPTAVAISLSFIGGGGGGSGSTQQGGGNGVSGGTTTVVLKDGATTITTWTATGGAGGSGQGAGAAGTAGQSSTWGTGGAGGAAGYYTGNPKGVQTYHPPTPGGAATGQGAAGGGGGGSGNGKGGSAGQLTHVIDYDISTLVDPQIVITIGAAGTGGGNGGAGSAGRVDYSVSATVPVRADVVPIDAQASGSFVNNIGAGNSFPDLGAGLWILTTGSNISGHTHFEIDDRGDTVLAAWYDSTITFVSTKTPICTYRSATRTWYYKFYKMGP